MTVFYAGLLTAAILILCGWIIAGLLQSVRFLHWIGTWIELGVVSIDIMTFNFYRPMWSIDYHLYLLKRGM